MSQCDPRGKIEVWLDIFDDEEPAQRPVFVHRRLTAAEFDDLDTQWRAVRKLEGRERRDRIVELFGIGMVDWRNQVKADTGEAVAFDAQHLGQVINHLEAEELFGHRWSGAKTSLKDKKKSELLA